MFFVSTVVNDVLLIEHLANNQVSNFVTVRSIIMSPVSIRRLLTALITGNLGQLLKKVTFIGNASKSLVIAAVRSAGRYTVFFGIKRMPEKVHQGSRPRRTPFLTTDHRIFPKIGDFTGNVLPIFWGM